MTWKENQEKKVVNRNWHEKKTQASEKIFIYGDKKRLFHRKEERIKSKKKKTKV